MSITMSDTERVFVRGCEITPHGLLFKIETGQGRVYIARLTPDLLRYPAAKWIVGSWVYWNPNTKQIEGIVT